MNTHSEEDPKVTYKQTSLQQWHGGSACHIRNESVTLPDHHITFTMADLQPVDIRTADMHSNSTAAKHILLLYL